MQPAVLRTLEFDRVREALALEARTPLGRARAQALEPATDPEEVARRLDLATEAVAFTRAGGSLAIDAPEDLATVLEGLQVDDRPLEPLHLLGLARLLDSVDSVSRGILSGAGGRMMGRRGDGLSAIAEHAASFEQEIRAVRRAIDASGEVNDDASPALRDIRDKLRRQRAKLRSSLEGLTRGRDTAKYLQEQIVTDRNGRYVIVVRAEHGGAIPGIVHGTSASGASLFLEPLATVELNNEVVALAERELEEIHRILLALTNAFRLRTEDLAASLDVAADLDELYARTRLAHRIDGRAPALASDGRLEFKGARHPLLMLRGRVSPVENSRDHDHPGPGSFPQGRPVPLVVGTDLTIIPPTRALVISGPNTGGKTVALKAAGLLSLMAQAGLLIPVDPGSAFTPFRSVFADIGDEQSISASLSTFSAHVANIVAMDRALDLPALVLLDEVGGGTDPAEGGALGTAVIDHFRLRGATVVATTHDDALKSYAATTAGVMTAAFGFNPDTYAPTYRLLYGAPGRSLALEIAERLGMPASVVASARTRRSERESQLAAHLARVDAELAALAQERQGVDAERTAVRRDVAKLADRELQVSEREAQLRKRTDDKLNERLREARAEIDRIVADLKSRAEALAERADRRANQNATDRHGLLSTGEVGGLRAQARAALGTVSHQLELTDEPAGSGGDRFDAAPEVGATVFVATFGADGIVRGMAGKEIDVEIRGKRMRVALGNLRRRAPSGGEKPRTRGAVTVGTAPRPAGVSRELVVVGATVDEAITRAEKFLDDALLGDERRLRVVHGHGTGRLREALRAYFREHPLVASVAAAPENEGGAAATIVELKD